MTMDTLARVLGCVVDGEICLSKAAVSSAREAARPDRARRQACSQPGSRGRGKEDVLQHCSSSAHLYACSKCCPSAFKLLEFADQSLAHRML